MLLILRIEFKTFKFFSVELENAELECEFSY